MTNLNNEITVTINGPDHLDKSTLTEALTNAISFASIKSNVISKNIKGTSTVCEIDGIKIKVHFNCENELEMQEC